MKRSLCSAVVAMSLLVGTSGAWAAGNPIIVDAFTCTQARQTYPGGGAAGFTAADALVGCSTDVLGGNRLIQAGNALASANASSVDVGITTAGTLALNTAQGTDGRGLVRWDGTSSTALTGQGLGGIDLLAPGSLLAGVNQAVFRIEISSLNVALLAALTICGDVPGKGNLCYTDEFSKPAPSDPGFHTPSQNLVNATTGPNEADHFLSHLAGPTCVVNATDCPSGFINFVDRAIDGSSSILHGNLGPVLGTSIDADVTAALQHATSIQLIARVDGGFPGQTNVGPTATSIDGAINCVEIVDGHSGDGPAVTAPGTIGGLNFPNGQVTSPTACHASAVPEPATLSLMGLGLVGLGLGAVLRRRGRQA